MFKLAVHTVIIEPLSHCNGAIMGTLERLWGIVGTILTGLFTTAFVAPCTIRTLLGFYNAYEQRQTMKQMGDSRAAFQMLLSQSLKNNAN